MRYSVVFWSRDGIDDPEIGSYLPGTDIYRVYSDDVMPVLRRLTANGAKILAVNDLLGGVRYESKSLETTATDGSGSDTQGDRGAEVRAVEHAITEM